MNQKQTLFVSEYLKTGNATQAYMTAYGDAEEGTAAAAASRLLRNVKVKAAIEEAQQQIMQNTIITVESIVDELKKIAFADLGQVVEWDESGVKIKPSAELTPAQRAAISEVSETSTKIGAELVNSKKTLKFYNKLTALDMLMKHTGGYVTLGDIIEKMTPEQLEQLSQKIVNQVKDNETKA